MSRCASRKRTRPIHGPSVDAAMSSGGRAAAAFFKSDGDDMIQPFYRNPPGIKKIELQLRRTDLVKTLPAIRRLRVGELELTGRNFRDAAKRVPVGQRQGKIGGGQHAEQGTDAVRESERERAVG